MKLPHCRCTTPKTHTKKEALSPPTKANRNQKCANDCARPRARAGISPQRRGSMPWRSPVQLCLIIRRRRIRPVRQRRRRSIIIRRRCRIRRRCSWGVAMCRLRRSCSEAVLFWYSNFFIYLLLQDAARHEKTSDCTTTCFSFHLNYYP